MVAPKIRIAALHRQDDMRGVAYVPELYVVKIDAPLATGAVILAEYTTAILVKSCDLWVQTALGSSDTCEIGVDDNFDALIDTADYDEETLNSWATNVGSSNADFPNGMILPAGDQLVAKFDGTPDGTGTVLVIFELFRLAEFLASPNYSFDENDSVAAS